MGFNSAFKGLRQCKRHRSVNKNVKITVSYIRKISQTYNVTEIVKFSFGDPHVLPLTNNKFYENPCCIAGASKFLPVTSIKYILADSGDTLY
jgi:hypothetical protein